MEQIINFKGTEYVIGEPTIEQWKQIVTSRSFKSPDEFYLDLISIATGLTVDDLRSVSMVEILNVIAGLTEYYDNVDTKFHNKFEFKGVEYHFVDLNNISFGHFIDIDTFGSQEESVRTQNLEKYMALLYVPKGEDYFKNLKERTKLFKELPVKYFTGSQSFFLRLEETLLNDTKVYSFLVIFLTIWIRLKRRLKKLSTRIGGGIKRCQRWLRTMLPKWKK